MEEKTGVIKAISQKEERYSLTFDGATWYSDFGVCPCKKGDEVKLEYEINGNFKNIKKIDVLKKSDQVMQGFREDKNASMILSYAKDLVVAGMEKTGIEVDIKAAMNLAAEAVVEAYKKIKLGIGEG
jgi:hypothetical protein